MLLHPNLAQRGQPSALQLNIKQFGNLLKTEDEQKQNTNNGRTKVLSCRVTNISSKTLPSRVHTGTSNGVNVRLHWNFHIQRRFNSEAYTNTWIVKLFTNLKMTILSTLRHVCMYAVADVGSKDPFLVGAETRVFLHQEQNIYSVSVYRYLLGPRKRLDYVHTCSRHLTLYK